MEQRRGPSLRKVVIVSSAGSAIEWYDFFIYGTAAALVFNKLFFPKSDPVVGTLLAFTTFAVGFLARPLGGMIFGHFGDKVGRKKALVAALFLMGGATTLIGLLPSYATLGVFAPILLVTLRLLQGIAVGGQWGGAVLVATESAPKNKRGLYGSFAQLGVPIGLVLSSLSFLILNASLSPQQFESWGWRVPFLLSVLLILVAYYAHVSLEETTAMTHVHEKKVESRSPVLEVLRHNFKTVALAAGSVIVAGAGFYLFGTYMLAYGTTVLGLPRTPLLTAVVVGAALQVPVLLGAAALSDRIGRRKVYLVGAAGFAVWAFPAFALANTASTFLVGVSIVVGQLLFATLYGPQAAFFSELFTARLRYSGASLGYQIGIMIGGAFTPIIASSLYAQTRSSTWISLFLVATSVISCLCVLVLSETYQREVDDVVAPPGTPVPNAAS
ncbi:MAG: MHS family MFS transporter [Actinomycetota bacterium]|nr:MHS family MFS transporter [Actinomycetota bacterium]